MCNIPPTPFPALPTPTRYLFPLPFDLLALADTVGYRYSFFLFIHISQLLPAIM